MSDELATLEISIAPTRDLDEPTRREIIAVCNRAFKTDEFDELFELITDDGDSMHVLGRIDGRLVSHATWCGRHLWLPDGRCLNSAHLDGVATDPDLQGRGIGSKVIERVMAEIAGFDIGTLSTDRRSFYARLGWQDWRGHTGTRSESGDVLTPDEEVMVYRTPRTPTLEPGELLIIQARGGNSW